ncbi:aminotransferase class V-fold PLP-dependent enzyme [Qipengyuania aquimaris]|nr:aminotransferase class V-fold PLP-dependent enzyme [Qipengyuania aquimaris]
MIASQRHLFSIPEDVHYLNCAYMAPLSHAVSAAMVEGARLKEQPWTFFPQDFFSLVETFREKAGRLVGTSPDNLAVVPSVSYGLAVAAANLSLGEGRRVVTLGEQFPSNVYPWQELAQREGGEVIAVRREAEACWTAAVLDAIDADTAIVALPHCHWADGRVVDLVTVGEKCRNVGAALVLDLTQSLGAMPVDFDAVKPDFAVAACYKWLMGPYGIGILYVDPKHHGARPIEQNWINRAGSQDFTRLVDYRSDYQPGARRFDMGEKSNAPSMMGAGAALDFLLDHSVGQIAETLAYKTTRLAEKAAELGLTSAPVGKRAPHFLSLEFPDGLPDGLTEKLGEAKVFVSARGQSLRVTPHLYNTEADEEALLATLHKVLG